MTLLAGASLYISNVTIHGSGLGYTRGGSLSSAPSAWNMKGVHLAQNSTLSVKSCQVMLDCATWWDLFSMLCGQGYGPQGSMRVGQLFLVHWFV